MSDEFDDSPPPVPASAAERARAPHPPIAALVAEVYRSARPPLRARLLECLLRPLGPLGLVAIAAGAFGAILQRGSYRTLTVAPEDAVRVSPEQMFELARYVEQANPDSLLQLGSLLAERPLGMAGLAASALILGLQAWRGRQHGG